MEEIPKPKKLREAGEVFLFMHRIFRASRNLRAHWYIDHLGQTVRIQPLPHPTASSPQPKPNFSKKSTSSGPTYSRNLKSQDSEQTTSSKDSENEKFKDPNPKAPEVPEECPKPPGSHRDDSDSESSSESVPKPIQKPKPRPSESKLPPIPIPDPHDEYSQEMTVIGIVPAGGDGTEVCENEDFLVTVNTKCTYISRYYRIVYVLDLSPSVVVADDESNCCLVDRVIPALRNSLRSSVKSFTIPGTDRVFRPQVFTSICLFTPFMKFEETFTLCQGVFVTESNVAQVIEDVHTKFVDIYKRLFTFSRPILELWGKLKRRHKHNKFDSLCESDSQSEENIRGKARERLSERNGNQKTLGDDDDEETVHPGGTSIMEIKRGIWKATEKPDDTNKQLSFASDKSYVAPDWSLIFMLRMGLLQIQMLPENTQSNLVIISDSVCGMPDEEALQNVLTQLRSYTVAFSFIQLQKKACTEPVFGHVGSSSLFYFMTMATFGTYLPREKKPAMEDVLLLTRNEEGHLVIKRKSEFDDIIDMPTENINQFHRALICWSFQNGLSENDYLLDTFAQINRDFLELQRSNVDRHRRFQAKYQATLNRMMYVRLREGFTLKSTVFVRNNTQVILTLRLAFRPLVFIDYIIVSAWPVNKNVHQVVSVELVLEGPYNELKDLLTESNYLNPIRMNLIKSVIDGIIDADRTLLHIHSFDTKIAYFTIPPGVTKEHALFQQGNRSKQCMPQLCVVRPDDSVKTQGFANFWMKMLEVDDRNWQKWVHTQTERCLLNLIHVPFELFTTRRLLSFDTRYPLNAVLFSVKVRATFCLVENQTFVTLVYATERAKKPSYFFIRKVISNGPVTIVKTAFLGGVTSIERRRAVEAQRQRLINVTYGTILNEEDLMAEAKRYRYEPNAEKLYMDPQKIFEKRFDPACTVFRRPIERMVVRYTHVPADLTTIVRAEERTDDPDEIMLLTLHNTLAKSLACRRSVIILNTFQLGGAQIVRLLADFCQNVLMHKRMHQEGFRPAWTQNNAVSLLRQVYDSSGASLEQFIMFPAITVQPDAYGRPILRRLSRYELKEMEMDKKSKKYYSEVQTTEDPTPNTMPLKTATETLAIVCEMWNEPEGGNPEDQLANMSAERRLHEDLRFISVLFTLDKIIRCSGQCTEAHQKIDTSKGLAGNPNRMFPYEDRCRVTSIYELTGIPKKQPMTSDEIAKRKRMFQKSRRRTERLKTQQDFEKEWEREQAGMLDVPKPPIPGEHPIRYLRKKAEGEEEVLGELDEPFPYVDNFDTEIRPTPTVTDIHADAVSKFVTVYENLFSMTNLIYHAQRRYFPLPHFVLGLGEKDMPRCNSLQLNALHCQLSEMADLTWILHDTEQDVVFADLVKTIHSMDRPKPTRLRVYVKALTARMVALIFAPVIDSFDSNSEVIPMFIATIHETQIAHCYAQTAFDEYGIVSLPMSDVPEKWDSGARFGWTPNNRNVFPEEATTFPSFCKHFEDEILPRIRMRAMYEAAQEEIPLNEDALMDMSAEVDCLEFEMAAIPKALRKVCKHLGPLETKDSDSLVQKLEPNGAEENLTAPEPPEPLKICCRGSNIAYMFDKMLAKNFKKVCGTQNMYYLNPQSMLEKSQKNPKRTKKSEKRKRQHTRGSSGMMYVDGTESLTSLSEMGDFSEELEIVKATTDENGTVTPAPLADDDATISPNSTDSESSESSDSDASTTSSDDTTPRPTSPLHSSNSSDGGGDPDGATSRNRVDSQNMGEVYQEYTGHNQPMFIQFNCSVNFQGQVNSFPISFLPTCVHELLPFLDAPPTRPEDIAEVEIVLELIVLTTQSLRPTMDVNEITTRLYKMAKSRVRNPYEFERHRRESYKKEEEEEDDFKNPDEMSDDDSESGKKSKKSGDVLFELPNQERRVMTELVRNVELVLELEKILLDSRTTRVDFDLLEMVKKYIDNACTTSGKFGHAETRYKPFLLVDGSRAKQRKFMSLMTDRKFGYLKLQRLRDSTLFYSKSINDTALFDKYTATNPPIPGTSSESHSILGSDFWIILTVDTITNNLILHFCQRNEHQHTPALDLLWAAIRQELRILNQESLLEMMYIQRKVDKLLVPEHRKISQFDNENGPNAQKTPPEPMRKPPQPPPGAMMPHEDLYYYFPEGYFACKAQRELWLPVPERVRNQSCLLNKNPLKMAFDRIKAPLLKYSVTNRLNTFVYKDIDRNQIYYFQLHMDRDSYELSIKGPEKKLRRKQAETIDKLLETKICMTLFGIHEPHRTITDEIWVALNEKLDSLLLVEIMRGYTQNLEQPLLINEIHFLQPKKHEPQMRQFFSIPSIFQDYLSSILYYIGQHIEALSDISPAKVKEKDVFYNGAAFNRTPVPTVWPAARSRSFRNRLEPIAQLQLTQPSFSKESLNAQMSPKEVPEESDSPILGILAHDKTEQSAIEEAVEATEAIGVFRSFSMDEKDPEPLNPTDIFRAHPPITGDLPPNYLLSSFFVYHILPARGVVDTGLALIEFRICNPDGSLIARFDQPAMNAQSHVLLVPNVPEDKATVYRDIIKSHAYPHPKPEKSICGYVEMIVRTRGDVADCSIFEKMMYELIEMSMFDVITEFGYLNTVIVEEGALVGHVALTMTNRNSDVFLPGQDTPSSLDQPHQPVRNLTKQGSASSVTASVDTRHHAHHHNTHHPHAMPSQSNEMRRSLVLQHNTGSSMDLVPPHSPLLPPAGQRTPAQRMMPQVSRELSEYVQENSASGFRRQDFMNRNKAYSIIKWFDHVASRQGETNSVIKQRIRFEFQHASLPALFEIRNRLEVSLGGLSESAFSERVYLCGLRKPSESPSDPCTTTTTTTTAATPGYTTSSLSIFTQPHEGRFEVLTTDPFHAMTEDVGVDESQNQEEYILISCIRNVFEGFGENDVRTKTQIQTMRTLFKNHLHGKYSPMVQTHIYSPRQRIMMAYLKGDFMTIYFYNYHTNIHKDAVDTMNKIVGFHNAKSRLLREIGLHKMGITHLSPFHTEPNNEYDYEVMIWTDPTTLISKEFPSEHKPPPAFMKEPQCSNIFFRMYRQPDLQLTMGRSKTLFKSDCVKTMHYEQLLRWRGGLKTKLDFIGKVTRAHVDMIKKIPIINEIDLLMFLRPPRVRSKLLGPPATHTSSSSSIRHRLWDDDHHTIYEDNNSMTERYSKRASLFGESVKSQAVAAESEIFKGKGEFLKKTDIKIGPAAAKFHEIRTPFFLRAEWNKDAPRRAGELFDEVVRESDIRSLLEEPLKEFLEIYEVQKVKSTKLLMKRSRKYSEKAQDVQVVDVVVKNEKRRKGEDPLPEALHPEDEWSEVDSDLEEAEEMTVEGDDGAESIRTNSESRGPPKPSATGEENFQRTYGKVRRSWKKNPPGSPTAYDSRHNSFSTRSRHNSFSIPMAKPSESGPIEKMFSSTINAVTKLTRRLSRKPVEKDTSIDKNGEDAEAAAGPAPSPEPTEEEFATEPAIPPIMYKHAEEFARYFCRKYGFIQFQVENRNRRSKALNRYTTNPTMFIDLPYLVFYKAYDGGVIFADLRYEIPEFVVSFYMYERAKSSSADFYMVDQMEALYWKESEELQTAAKQLKDSVCFMTFNFDYHLRTVATYIEAKVNKKKCIFGTKMNAFHTLERLLDYYQHELILSKNLVAIKYVYLTKEQNDAILARAEDDRGLVLIRQEADPVTQRRYAGTPIEDVMCRITDTTLYKTNLPVTIIEMTGLLSAFPTISGRQCSRVVPAIKMRIHLDDVGDDGVLWPPSEDRDFVEAFEGRQRRRLLENMSKYGTEVVPTAWEDSCVRRTVKEMMGEGF